jgi:hypothetical protein
MASNWSLPTNTTLYSDVLARLKERDDDLARGLDPFSSSTPTDIVINAIRWNTTNKRWEKYNGTSWNPLEASYSINISGTATNVTGTVAIANGGTGSSSASVARTNLNVPSRTGDDASGNWNIGSLKLVTPNWTIEQSGADLVFKNGTTTVARLTSAGVFTAVDINSSSTP